MMKKIINIAVIIIAILFNISCGDKDKTTVDPSCAECPTITSVSPGIGFAGDSVKIVGKKFKGLQTVYFGNQSVTNFTLSGDTITVEVPQPETGKEKDSVTVSVAISNPDKPSTTLNSNVKGTFKYAGVVVEEFAKYSLPVNDFAVDKLGNLYLFERGSPKSYIKRIDAITKQVTTVLSSDNIAPIETMSAITIDQTTNKLYVAAKFKSNTNDERFRIYSTNLSTTLSLSSVYISKIYESFGNNFNVNNENIYVQIVEGFGSSALLANGIKTPFFFGSFTDDFKVIGKNLVALQYGTNIFTINLFKDFTNTNPIKEIIVQDNTPSLSTLRSNKFVINNNKLVYILNNKLFLRNLYNTNFYAADISAKVLSSINLVLRGGVNNELFISTSGSILKLTIK